MNIERIIQKPIGGTVKANFMRYENGSKNVVPWFHGVGESGPPDGSTLQLVEKLEGPPRFAKGIRPGASTVSGFIEYPFDIVAIQVERLSDVKTSYDFLRPHLFTFLHNEYGYENIIIGGISMGNYGAWRMIQKSTPGIERVKGIVAICGSGSINVSELKLLPGIAWHGYIDDVVSYKSHKVFVDSYNAAGGSVEFNTLTTPTFEGTPSIKHNAWTYAFNTNPAKDRTVQKVNEIFAQAQINSDLERIRAERNALKTANADLVAKNQAAQTKLQSAL